MSYDKRNSDIAIDNLVLQLMYDEGRTPLVHTLESIYSRMKFEGGKAAKICTFGVGHFYGRHSDGREVYMDSEGYGLFVSPEGRRCLIRRSAEDQDMLRRENKMANDSKIDRLKYAIRWMFAEMTRRKLFLLKSGEDPPKRPDELRPKKEVEQKEICRIQTGDKDRQTCTAAKEFDFFLRNVNF
ncbi:hypothetical protein NHQ30_009759 [Ciborinia camelliae]|nr:hypothetical protein NHQ30_009759 [Ciborinia camelliae]